MNEKENKKERKVKTQLVISPDLLEKVDKEAEKMYLSRSAYICVAIAQKIQQDMVVEQLPILINELQKDQYNKSIKGKK